MQPLLLLLLHSNVIVIHANVAALVIFFMTLGGLNASS